MPCTSRPVRREQTLAERNAEVKAALKALEQKLLARSVRLVVGPTGAVAFAGWSEADRSGISDVCAYRALAAENSWALRAATMAAEAQAGRKVNQVAVSAGVHSHDGGRTWSRH